MKHIKGYFLLLILICSVGLVLTRPQTRHPAGQLSERLKEYYVSARADAVNEGGFELFYNGEQVDTSRMGMSFQMHMMMPISEAIDLFQTSIMVGKDGAALIGGYYVEDVLTFPELATPEEMMVDLEKAAEALGVEIVWQDSKCRGDIWSEIEEELPVSYDLRDEGVLNPVESQGNFGTCWAFAATAALEASLKDREADFSVDHMTMNSGFHIGPSDGGDYNMALAYLSSWKGPVREMDDPYGDGVTDASLTAVQHLQEARLLKERDLDEIKWMVQTYGAVESSLYMSIENETDVSEDYQPDYSAYYYDGDAEPNHDVVIVGWDDHFSRGNFYRMPERDGAFICRNSWGESFGDDGYFYVSYEDAHLGKKGMVYSRLDSPDNYDQIYQSDLLGWVGAIGYQSEEAWFANVYTPLEDEVLRAVGFYSVENESWYDIYVVPDCRSTQDLQNPIYLGSGYLENSGYYTVDLAEGIPVAACSDFAVMIRIRTAGTQRPVAIEYAASELTESADLSDGRGFLSYDGQTWVSAETEYGCNLCLKAFTQTKEKE